MQRFLLQRVAQAAVVLFLISIGLFGLINSAPGDPVTAMLAADPSGVQQLSNPVEIARQRHLLGLDKPWPVRYVLWLEKAFQGDLGRSFVSQLPVSEILLSHLVPTLILTTTAMLMTLLIGVPLGVISALKQYSFLDQLLGTAAFMGISVPGFYLAIIALYLFALKFPIFPTFGMQTLLGTPVLPPVLDIAWHVILPASVLALGQVASYLRYMRAAVQEVMGTDYVRMARAKGATYWRVVVRHMFPNALIPLVTLIGLSIPGLFGGTVIIETIFSWPGLGYIGVDAVGRRDYLLVMGFNLMIAVLVLGSNLLTDVVYSYVDPRIRYQ
jgi:peptide/nickel transport system permease protein